MKKQFMLSLGVLALSMTLIFNSYVSAQSKVEPNRTVSSAVKGSEIPGSNQNDSKHLTRAQFQQLSGAAQEEVMSSIASGEIVVSDLVNSTPANLAHRIPNTFYVVAGDFKSLPKEKQWQVLKNPEKFVLVQDAAQIPKIEISRAEYDALPQSKKEVIRNSSEYTILN